MNDASIRNPAYLSLTDQQLAEMDELCDRFDRELVNGRGPRIEKFLADAPLAARDGLLAELLVMELEYRAHKRDKPQQDEYIQRFQEQRHVITSVFARDEQVGQFLESPTIASNSEIDKASLPAPSADGNPPSGRTSGAAAFREYLKPTTRDGWLGRLGHYEIEEVLGRGGFGIVAKAFDEKLHRVVAIKLLHPELATTSPPRKRFLREARSAAKVTHENIVAVYAVEEEPIPYLAMEYIAGQTLQQRMDDKGPLDVADVLRIGQQVAAGLAAAHAVHLIHRDIKPANILLTDGAVEKAKISDFGLARAVDDASMTSSGMIAGTPMYMAPEQARGETLDHRADLFSLGSVLYQMASGRPPFRAANTVAVLKRVCEDTPRPLHDVIPETPDWLHSIIFRLLEKDREDRFQSAHEVADLLARYQRELEHGVKVVSVPTPGSAVFRDAASNKTTTSAWAKWLLAAALFALAILLPTIIGLRLARWFDKAIPTLPQAESIAASGSNDEGTITTWHGWPADAPAPAIAPFNAEQAQHHQAAWAEYLGVRVEYTNSLGMKFRLIPPGEFLMGRTPDENAATLKDVFPGDIVILTQPIYLGVNEVTQAEYEKVMGVNPSHFAPLGMGQEAVAGLNTTEHPVEMVSWYDAAEFSAKLSKQEKLKPFYFREGDTIAPLDGTGYRLPSEAEWEFACRAGTLTKYWIGDKDEDLVRAGWFRGNSGGRTHAAGELKANPFGLADIHGNVWEWVQDGWDATFYGQFQDRPAINPNVPFYACPQRVLRGGHWGDSAYSCGSSPRLANVPTNLNLNLGFRVSLVVDSVKQSREKQPAAPSPVAARSWHGWPADAPPPIKRKSIRKPGQNTSAKWWNTKTAMASSSASSRPASSKWETRAMAQTSH